jgi:hypothetical protein
VVNTTLGRLVGEQGGCEGEETVIWWGMRMRNTVEPRVVDKTAWHGRELARVKAGRFGQSWHERGEKVDTNEGVRMI